ncbi:hypothetical protein ACQJBY_056661 [Aegilops geniculata]
MASTTRRMTSWPHKGCRPGVPPHRQRDPLGRGVEEVPASAIRRLARVVRQVQVLIVAHIPVNTLVKKTSPKKYYVQPNNDIVAPRSTFVVLVGGATGYAMQGHVPCS